MRITVSVFLAVPQSWSKRKRAEALAGILWPTVKPDWDNVGKQCDALKGIVWVDDKQVVIATVFKCYAEAPGLMIEVDEIGAARAAAAAKAPLVKRQEPELALTP